MKTLATLAVLCLVQQVKAAWESCNGVSGTCIDVRSYNCTTGTLTGKCPGPYYNKCCPSSGGVQSSDCTARGGLCKRTVTCTTGSTIPNLCPGPVSVTCCLNSSATTSTGSTTGTTSPGQGSASGFAADLASTTNSEYATYGGLHECNSETMSRRIGVYWNALNRNLNRCNVTVPWSAAFISYMIRQAGAGTRFRYSGAHRLYIQDAFAGGQGLYGSVLDAATATVKTGDLVCVGRGTKSGWSYADFVNWYNKGGNSYDDDVPAHCDIVVSASGNSITVIGGNLSDTVKRSTVSKTRYAIVLPVSS